MELSGWGRFPRQQTRIRSLLTPDDVLGAQKEAGAWIARGNGRSYGDAAVGVSTTLMMKHLTRFLAFDEESGRLTAEAGLLLSDLLDVFVPRGFFPPVVPGTKFVTLGGMLATDVHGKNHHRDGGFGRHVESFRLALPRGPIVQCSPSENAELFKATIGGMGLTGIVLDVTFRLSRIKTGWIRHQTTVAENLEAAMKALEDANSAHYSVAWIDCLASGNALGRSLVYRGDHASRADMDQLGSREAPFPNVSKGRLSVPLDFPALALNRYSVGAFNALYFRRGASAAANETLVSWNPFFFPLDGIQDWNRIYGARGFVQHQCVIPHARSRELLTEILGRIARRGNASFLAVLKSLGPGDGLLSFPMPGYTLALDFSMSAATLALLDDIDGLIAEAGGRNYLAKDSRQSRETFEAGYHHALPEFRRLRDSISGTRDVNSYLSKRLGI